MILNVIQEFDLREMDNNCPIKGRGKHLTLFQATSSYKERKKKISDLRISTNLKS